MTFVLRGIEGTLDILNAPADWKVVNDSELKLKSGPKTDFFFSPDGTTRVDNAPAALFNTLDQYFSLSARVHVEFAATFDAGVLQIRTPGEDWAKVCFEYSPFKEPMIVSVVTRGKSDDCNSAVIAGNEVYLRIARLGKGFAFHYSTDGIFWNLVRHFALDGGDRLRIGFSTQSPTGQGCAAHFSEIEYRAQRITDIRSGM